MKECKWSLLFLAAIILTSGDKVTWKVASIPPVFGSTIILQCTLVESTKCLSTGIWRWTGGKDFRLISLKDITSNRSKYQSVLESCTVFSLIIYNFSESDVNLLYSCEFNFLEDRKLLSLSEYPFEYHPEDADVTKHVFINHNTLYCSITIFKVYPIPHCSTLLLHQDISSYSRVYINKQGLFYMVNLRLNFKLNAQNCKGNLIISCVVGQFSLEIVTKRFDTCVEEQPKASTDHLLPLAYIIPSVLVIIVIITGILWCACGSGRSCRSKYRYTASTNRRTRKAETNF